MPAKTNLNISPYNDDFSESKSFYRILFKPSYAVQARELNQLQTILQNQIEKFGGHIFEDGSPVVGGELLLNTKVKSLKLETLNSSANEIIPNNFNKQIIEGAGGARGQVISVSASSGVDPITLIYEPLNGIDFGDGESITTADELYEAVTVSAAGNSGLIDAQGDASIVSINKGFYFINGFFVFVEKQDIILEKYSTTPTYRVGLTVTESLPKSTDDVSLLDNAQGTFNFAAPGADRLKIELILTKRQITGDTDVDKNSDVNFYELLRVVSGVEVKNINYPLYSTLEKTLARRTYDESGDYTVKPFGLQIVDHNPQDGSAVDTTNKFSVGLEPGKAYIKGFEFENISTEYVSLDKGKETLNVSNFIISSGFGNKVITKNASGFFNIKKNEMLDLHCVNASKLSIEVEGIDHGTGSDALAVYNATKIGTARIRDFDWYAESNSSNTTHFHSDYETYLYDIRISSSDELAVQSASQGSYNTIYLNASASDIDGAYDGVNIKIITTISGTTTIDNRTILSYTGSNKKAILDKDLSAAAGDATETSYVLNFSFADLESLIAAHGADNETTNISGGSGYVYLTSSIDVDEVSKFNNDPSGDAFLADTDRNTLLFELPNSPIQSINGDISYQARILFEGETTSTGADPGKTTITTSLGTFVGGGSTSNDPDRNNENYVVVVKDKGSEVTVNTGQILNFGEGSGRSITFSSDTTATIDADVTDQITIDIISTIDFTTTGNARTKSLVIGQTDNAYETSNTSKGQVCFQTPNKTPLKRDVLMIPDVFRLVKVVDSANSSNPVTAEQLASVMNGSNTSIDITENYILDTGQRDNYYDWGSLILKVGSTPPVGQILAIVDYFENSGNGCFTVNSYQTDITAGTTFNNETETFTYDTIPSYTSSVSGKIYQLRDCLDFRPVRKLADNDDGANTENSLISEGPERSSYTQAFDESQIIIPTPDANITVDYSHYLGRIDKLLLTRDQEFKVLKGVSSVNPVSPPDDDDSMTLYIIKIPPYTFNLTDIETKYIDNKRYTMRDIGKLEKRIEQLEYYATLSLLERETTEKPITSENNIDSAFNPTGERFKSGILVDGFSGHSVGDVQQEEYLCAIDYDKKLLRPRFETDAYQFEFGAVGSTSLNVQKTGDLITLPYSTVEYINQPLVSTNVQINPFGVKNFTGKMKSYPDSSVFYDRDIRPVVLVNLEGQYDNWAYNPSTNGFGTHWNDWSDIWTGKFVNTDPELSITKSESSLRRTKLVGEVSTKLGIKTNKTPESIFKLIGNKIVNVSIVPYIEPQTVFFAAKGVKPETDMWLFFGEKSVMGTDYSSKTADRLSISGVNDDFKEGETITETDGAIATILSYTKTGANTAIIDIKLPDDEADTADNLFASGTVTGSQSGASATVSSVTVSTNVTKFTSSSYGTVTGSFNIVSGRHLSGENLLRLIDVQSGDISTCTSVAEKIYYSLGTLPTREKLISSTRPYVLKRPNINEKYIVQNVTSENLNQGNLVQPLNQTFYVDPSVYSEGIFINDLTLYFKSKPSGTNAAKNPPVIIQIRPVFDGFPSPSIVLPFSEVVKDVNSVAATSSFPSTSNDEHKTTFSFESPVYLSPGEYAITIQSNSQDYELWTATTSSNHQGTNNNITKQPYVGGLYKLQKSGIWNRIETESLMFSINRCSFISNSVGYAYFLNKNTTTSGVSSNTSFSTFKFINNMLLFNSSDVGHDYQISNSTNQLQSAVSFSSDQNITLTNKGYIFSSDTGTFTANVNIKTSNEDVSPVIDISRMTLITAKNIINNGKLSNNDFVIANSGTGYTTSGLDVELYGGGPDPSVNTITATQGTAGVSLVLEDGGVVGVTVTDGGTGYVTNPNLVVTHSTGSGAVILVNSETSADKGNLEARYITRRVTLRDGFDASDLRVILNAYKPQGTEIYVYYKVISGTDSEPFDDKPYRIMKQYTSSGTVSANENDFKEFEYVTYDDTANYTNDEGVLYDTFKTFAIKVCMTSDDDTEIKVPKIRDLRAIALAD